MRSALGRGLSSLISTPVAALPHVSPERQHVESIEITSPPQQLAHSDRNDHDRTSEDGIRFIPIDSLSGNPSQPRREFKETELRELSDSIKSKGVLQPVLVRPVSSDSGTTKRYEIIAGERRWRAAKLAGLTVLPAIVRSLDDRETLEISIIENVQREDLSPIEEAQAYQRLANEFCLSQQEIAEKVGKDRASVSNYMRLLKLPPEIIEMLKSGSLSMGHAKAILTIKEPSAQISLARKVASEVLTVRQLEAIVSRVVVLDAGHRLPGRHGNLNGQSAQSSAESLSEFPDVLDRMRNSLGTKVVIKHHRSGRGRIEIEYFSEQELDRVVEHICR